MKTKEEVIKDAWGHNIPNGGIDENGWSKKSIRYEYFDLKGYDSQNYLEGAYIRPKSLKGIGDNNGWIAIDDKIKVDNGKYWVRFFNPDTNIESLEVINVLHGVIDYYFATHYQPINKPLKPLY